MQPRLTSLLLSMILLLSSVSTGWAETTASTVAYLPLTPAFITNYGGPGRLKYVKVDITLMVSDPRAVAALEQHMPLVRNTLMMSLASQTEANVTSPSGQERIRRELLQELNSILSSQVGAPLVDEVLFTNFIYQN